MNITLRLNSRPRKDGTTIVFFDVAHKLEKGEFFRTSVNTPIKINPKDLNKTSLRVKASVRDSEIINKSLKELIDKRDTALNKFQAGDFTIQGVVSYLKGESSFKTVDDYVQTVIKNSRTHQTYSDYKNIVHTFKIHSRKKKKILDSNNSIVEVFDDRPVTWNEFMNFEQLSKFKQNAEAKGVRGTTINSYFNKIRAIINDAYDKQYIYTPFKLYKKLKSENVRRKPIKTSTPIEFTTAINQINNIYDAQAIGLYLVMFMLRGMYPADIVTLNKNKFNNINDSDPLSKLCEEGFDYITHRRSKTKKRSNDDLIIRVDQKLLELIQWLKISFYLTHYHTPQRILLADFNDDIAIFNYDVDDVKTHKNLWDVYQKRVKKLLNTSYNTARKTYNTYALELDMSDSIRRILLGHIDRSTLAHYDNTETKLMREKVKKAEIEILKEFKAFELIDNLFEKIKTLDLPSTLKFDDTALNEDALIDSFKS